MPRLSSFSPFGLNLWTWCPFVPALLPEKSATHTLPSLSTEMPCGVTITPLPKFASTAPVLRSNLKTGSTGVGFAVDGAAARAAGRAGAAALVGPDVAVLRVDVDAGGRAPRAPGGQLAPVPGDVGCRVRQPLRR